MSSIAFHTLGCKVNQYDTQAMRELFERAGYEIVDFHGAADIYMINTCTVTGTGDAKSMKLIRRIHREHPNAALIVCGCLAQRDAARVSLPGVRLVLGVKHRAQVVQLLERALREDMLVNAVDDQADWTFETLSVTRHEGKTRAVMKIQEGCDRYCAYCIIPYVRGPVRSMPLCEVINEAQHLADEGYQELVLTGIHLASYGRGTEHALVDAIRAVQQVPGVVRIRLGSLEPPLITDEFVQAILPMDKLCPQFHLSMQSGSAGVLGRMKRRYSPDEYLLAARRLRRAFPGCAITTDVLTGFPGETDEEANETLAFVQEVGFARIHVFPYSRRAGTVADALPDQVPEQVKRERAHQLIELGNQLETLYVKSLLETVQEVLFETTLSDGLCEGYARQYVRVLAAAQPGERKQIRITSTEGSTAYGIEV
ncbi:tRNA (N(6)-L-threonylcarbamoyladenosine(37)-C(2))-methylthiotransferase MtaB [Eubacteriales bacterium OttesenSCG-928-N13]|nr:tRNA (N(6)-L-threonylcarbamoyladenosine(37)-C(2))-methylthiotransferase MtaB [Eubacteriales bacterium OttesenSCG-928-N13]